MLVEENAIVLKILSSHYPYLKVKLFWVFHFEQNQTLIWLSHLTLIALLLNLSIQKPLKERNPKCPISQLRWFNLWLIDQKGEVQMQRKELSKNYNRFWKTLVRNIRYFRRRMTYITGRYYWKEKLTIKEEYFWSSVNSLRTTHLALQI